MSKPPSNRQHGRGNHNTGRMEVSINDVDKANDADTPSTSPLLPSLAQSSSNSSSSPPEEPSTPPPLHNRLTSRSRTRSRYPHDLGRVPLHRRGTSKTYETLEDLLKEAGYKDTRIFTPETERSDGGAKGEGNEAGKGEESRLSVVKDGMEAVVGFFAGLLPSAASSKTSLVSSASTLEPSTSNGNGSTSESATATAQPEPLTASPQEYSPPASPSPTALIGFGAGAQRSPNLYGSASSNSGSRQGQRHEGTGAGRRSIGTIEPPTPTTVTSSNLTSYVDSLNRADLGAGAGEPTPKVIRSRPGSATTLHSQTHPQYQLHAQNKSPVPRTPSLLSADYHPHSLHRPSSRSSMSRPGSSQGQYRSHVQAPPTQGPSGSAGGMPHLPSSSQSQSQSHSSALPRGHHQPHQHQHHQHHTPTPLTQSNLHQHQYRQLQHQAHPQHLHPHHHAHQHAHHHHQQQHLHHNSHQSQIVSPRPSRASAYLRHVASIPAIPDGTPTSRPSSTPVNFLSSKFSFSSLTRRTGQHLNVSLNDKDSEDEDGPPSVYYRSGPGEEEERGPEHPMPPTWLETVARAVLFGGGSVGGPHTPAPAARPSSRAVHTHHMRVQALRPTRSSLSQASRASHVSRRSARSQLSDSTNFTDGRASSRAFLAPPSPSIPLHPPALFAKLERGRAGRSEGEVFKTRVICRSAPGSRSASVVRGTGADVGDKRILNFNLTSSASGGKSRKRKKDTTKEEVPSLARTRAEGDVLWSAESKRNRNGRKRRMRSDENRHTSNFGGVESDSHRHIDGASDSEGFDHSGSDSDFGPGGADDDEDDEEGELDLARMLVPPKRQNSIRSLRKHLVGPGGIVRPTSRGAGAGASPVPPVPPLPSPLSKGSSGGGAQGGSGRLTPNMAHAYRKPFRTTSLQSSEWDDVAHDRDFDGWRKGAQEDDDEHERERHLAS